MVRLKYPKRHSFLLALAFLSSLALTAFTYTARAEEPIEFANSLFKTVNPEFKTAKDKEVYLVNNMRRVQAATEAYATKHEGRYPTKVDNAFKSYFMMGDHDDKTFNAWSNPFNPYTGKRAWMVLGKVSDADKARRASPEKIGIGVLEYSPIRNGTDYAIRAGGADGKTITEKVANGSGSRIFVLSSDPSMAVLACMKMLQWCVEAYAEDHEGQFPRTIDDSVKIYFPQGDAERKIAGKPIFNPITRKSEWPLPGKVTDLFTARHKAPEALAPGRVEYSCLPSGRNYAIRGGGKDGKTIVGIFGPKSTMVIAKDADGKGHE